RQIQITDHGPDQGELLVVLFPEIRPVRAGEVEQLEHNGQHAVEEARAAGPFEHLTQRAGIDAYGRLTVRVHHLPGRGENQVNALIVRDLQVVIEGSGVPVEVLVRPEL